MPKERKKLPQKSQLALESPENLQLVKNSPQYLRQSVKDDSVLHTPTIRGDGEVERREGVLKGKWCVGYTNKSICLCKRVSQMCSAGTIRILFVTIQAPFVQRLPPLVRKTFPGNEPKTQLIAEGGDLVRFRGWQKVPPL
jgi:hypothetical protein